MTTQKDLVKIRLDRLGERELWALQIQLQMTSGQDALEEAVTKNRCIRLALARRRVALNGNGGITTNPRRGRHV